ncbi:hypothetical protein JTE90_008244 [Oedothorax gibbosus]|uniref:Uncharacterized protein n=1 Tax=Oedothorax gibbosus TaxID=931172 RepID=A0AAV6TF97_9ARAC|nr:hypothetical protein JTE90_008244 [Oedothorax gibbosus]
MVASHHWPLDQAHEPSVRTCGSSRTEQDYYRNDESSYSSVKRAYGVPAEGEAAGIRPHARFIFLRFGFRTIAPTQTVISILESQHISKSGLPTTDFSFQFNSAMCTIIASTDLPFRFSSNARGGNV